MIKEGTTRKITVPAQELPVLTEAEVCVVGGGTAGMVAAIAAARTGAKTALVERNGFVGGCNTATYNTGPGWVGDSDNNRVMGGPGWEFLQRMIESGNGMINAEKRWKAQIFPEATKEIALEMVVEAGVELYLHTWAGDILKEGSTVKGLMVQSKSGRQAILAKTFVDCSADADVAAQAGAQFEKLDKDDPQVWQVSIDLTVCNIDAERVLRWCEKNKDILEDGGRKIPPPGDCSGVKTGVAINIKSPETRTYKKKFGQSGRALKGMEHRGTRPTLKLMIRRSTSRVQGNVEIDATDVKQITWAEIEGRRRAYQHLQYLKDTIDGMQDAFIIGQNPLGVRVTRRILGEYYITIDDLVENTRLPDVVSLNCRSLDKHLPGDKFEIHFLEGTHDVPYRALIPIKVDNVLVAGRCISCDHESHSSLRGAATCWGTGHAAGTAAALASRGSGKTREVNILQLQQTLLSQGAILSTEGRKFEEEVEIKYEGVPMGLGGQPATVQPATVGA